MTDICSVGNNSNYWAEITYIDGLIYISKIEYMIDDEKDVDTINSILNRLTILPKVGTEENFKSIMKNIYDRSYSNSYMKGNVLFSNDSATNANMDMAPQAVNEEAGDGDYSATNIQVSGVDEMDTTKTDGEYIYQVNNNRVLVIKALPANDMKIITKFSYEEDNFTPNGLYVDSKRMVVVGYKYKENLIQDSDREVMGSSYIMPSSYTKVYIYNIENKENIVKEREFEIEGYYVDSRKIDGNLYLLSNKDVLWNVYYSSEGKYWTIEPVKYMDSKENSDGYKTLSFDRMWLFSGAISSNSMNVSAINIYDNNSDVKIDSFGGR